jgi:hypothetical protein
MICEIPIGARLYGGGVVTSRYLFDGAATRMFRINGIHVSGNHYVREPELGEMVHAAEHPDAIPAESLPRIWCLATSNNWIPVQRDNGRVLMCADYEESYDPSVIAEAQKAAERALNGPAWIPSSPVADFSLGVDPAALVLLQDGSTKPIANVEIGDVLVNGARIMGVIREICETQCHLLQSSTVVSAAQLIFCDGKWQRATNRFAPVTTDIARSELCHLMLVGGEDQIIQIMDPQTQRSYLLRDYAEVEDDVVQAPYDRAMMTGP